MIRIYQEGSSLIVMAEKMGLGGSGTGLGRSYRVLPIDCAPEAIVAAQKAVEADLWAIPADRIERQTFAERLEQ